MREHILSQEQIGIIMKCAAQAEVIGQLHPEVLKMVIDQQWFKLFVPKVYGGPGKQLPEILRLEEAIAAVDGSLAWTVTLCSGAAWFTGFLDEDLAKEICNDPKICFAGSGAVGGTAQLSDRGYLINGYWKYASGALHATIFTANCRLQNENGEDLLDDSGQPIIKSFILKKEEVTILSGWDYFGLVATGSHAFEVKDLEIPNNRSFEINQYTKLSDEGFDYPFLQLAETTLAVNSLGMAQHFLQLVEDSFFSRSGYQRYNEDQLAFFKAEYLNCKQELDLVRTKFYDSFDRSWDAHFKQQSVPQDLLDEVSLSSRRLAHVSRKVTDILFPYCGLEAAKKNSEINRVWRDIHTASQHALLTFEK